MQMETFNGKKMVEGRDVFFQEVPPYPTNLSLTLTNACNHRCITCTNGGVGEYSEGGKARMSRDLAFSIMEQAYSLGAKEVGLHGGGPCEPFLSPILEDCILFAKNLGYNYIYITTNGSLATEERLRKVFENGLHSIRFSINAGNKETYKKFHGLDHFDKAITAVKTAKKLIKEINPDIILTVSFVQTKINECEFEELKALLRDYADSMYLWEGMNLGGKQYDKLQQGIVLPNDLENMFRLHSKIGNGIITCPQPFNRFQVSVQGWLNPCCAAYKNYLAIADLNEISLKDAWGCENFRIFRKMLMEKRIPKNIQCYNCFNNANEQIFPFSTLLQ